MTAEPGAAARLAPIRLRADAMTLARGGAALARGVSIALGPGEALVVRGPNAAGKTSLLRMIAGLTPEPGGRLALQDADGGPIDPVDAVAWAGHLDGLRAEETPRAHLSFHAAWMGGAGDAATVAAALAEFGLTAAADRPARRLSAGQRRRAALARVSISGRPLWLLDEPAGPLDEAGRATLAHVVARHRARGGLVVAAAHHALDWPDADELRLPGTMPA